MTTDRLHDNWPPQPDVEHAVYGRPRLVSLPHGVVNESTTLEETPITTEEVFVQAFSEQCQDTHGIDILSMVPKDKPLVTHTAHQFLAASIDRQKARKQAKSDPNTVSGKPFRIPDAPVDKRIDEYYKQFGVNRRQKSPALLKAELQYLENAKKPIFVDYVDDKGQFVEQHPAARTVEFPEVGFAIKLMQLLQKQGVTHAADSIEVLVASYGSWFPQRVLQAGQTILRVNEHNELIKRITIPDNEQPDRPGGFRRR
jgi:hypothetical protein